MQLRNALMAAPTAIAVLTAPALAQLALAQPALAQSVGDYHSHMGDWGWGGMIYGPLMMILFLAVAVAVVVLLVRWLGGPGHHGGMHHGPPGKTSLDILKDRFAKGEIDKEEFEERRRVLGD